MPRTKRLEGVETREGQDGTKRYRGTAYVHGSRESGPWTTGSDEERHRPQGPAMTLMDIAWGVSAIGFIALAIGIWRDP